MAEPAARSSKGKDLLALTFMLALVFVPLVGCLAYFRGVLTWYCVGCSAIAFLSAIGTLTWGHLIRNDLDVVWRRSQGPLEQFHLGKPDKANATFLRCLEQAKSYSDNDPRRALMLSELARYLAESGKPIGAIALFAESQCIVAKFAATEPVIAARCLNHQALFQIQFRRFSDAQPLLEEALQWCHFARVWPHTQKPFLYEDLLQCEILLMVNLAYLCLETGAVREAEHFLVESDAAILRTHPNDGGAFQDTVYSMRTRCYLLRNEIGMAATEFKRMKNQQSFTAKITRSKLHLVRKEYREAHDILSKVLVIDAEKSRTSPMLLGQFVDYAEALFGIGDFQNAFFVFQLANSMVAYNNLPRDLVWRNTISVWLQRAREIGNHDAAQWLHSELQREFVPVHQAIMALDRFHFRSPENPPPSQTPHN